ncbi:MAG: hypothetical protein KGY38_07815 [Desulfobacterales bacterium]|nr:hypothetical protein [Desulfobacterales bacterium]MBS3810042.1 hypothetical protein [Desulfobacterales bacterium]
MTTSQNPTENHNMYMEEEGMKSLRRLVDECAQALSEQDLSLEQAETRIEKTREQVLDLFPGKEEQFELIYRPRFERIIQERSLK